MKISKFFCFFAFASCFSLFAQTEGTASVADDLYAPNGDVVIHDEDELDSNVEDDEEIKVTVEASKGGIAEVPAAKRPKPIDKKKADAAAEKDEDEDTYEDNINTIKYGMPSEIAELIDELIENEDPRYTEEIYDVFQTAKNPVIKQKVLQYFTKLEDPCLENFAVELLNDPYDEKSDVVKASFQYIAAVKTTAAIPAVVSMIESENEVYFNDAITTIGEIGGPAEALFLVEYLERDDLGDAKRQILMRTCGKMHAVETWDKLVEVLQDEDENSYVRMYAAESIGLMEKPESVPVLIDLFNEGDPNLRQYVIKGLSHFPNNEDAKATIIQGIRDDHWRVRQEAIRASKEMELKESTPFLIYRSKNDGENVIKTESYKAIGSLNTKEGNDYLIEQLQNKKVGDGAKKTIAEVLISEGNAGEKEVIALALECVDDDKRKDLRYALGKTLAKYSKASYEEVCLRYLQSKDVTTINLGMDMYKNHKFGAAEAVMRNIYADKKANAGIKNRIKSMLKIQDEDEKKEVLKQGPLPSTSEK